MEKICIPGITTREVTYDVKNLNCVTKEDLLEVLYTLELSIAQAHANEVAEENWNYIPASHLTFLKTILTVPDRTQKAFLEVGCGVGTKLYLAKTHCSFRRIHGIEINKTYANIARQMVNSPAAVSLMDAREFPDYHRFDVIYSYAPMRGPASEELFSIIREKMKPGATFFFLFFSREITIFTKGEGLPATGFSVR